MGDEGGGGGGPLFYSTDPKCLCIFGGLVKFQIFLVVFEISDIFVDERWVLVPSLHMKKK